MGASVPTLLEWQLMERHFAGQAYDGDQAPPLHTQASPQPLILTAVHAVNHYRVEDPKPADLFTGSLTLLLAERLGCNAAINTHKNPAMNCTWGTPPVEAWLEQRIGALSKTPQLLDLHGARNGMGFDVALGTGGPMRPDQKPWVDHLTQSLEAAGFEVVLNAEGYAALSPRSLTYRVREKGLAITPLQIEIARRWREPNTDLERANRILVALTGALKA